MQDYAFFRYFILFIYCFIKHFPRGSFYLMIYLRISIRFTQSNSSVLYVSFPPWFLHSSMACAHTAQSDGAQSGGGGGAGGASGDEGGDYWQG